MMQKRCIEVDKMLNTLLDVPSALKRAQEAVVSDVKSYQFCSLVWHAI